jgi:CTP:molybdopterin cytidylyltransferase MocA
VTVAALVLAGGGSSRLGRPKQLLRWGEATLLDHVLHQVRRWGIEEIWVVLGAHADAVREQVDLTAVGVVENPEWEEGLASSLRAGLDAIGRLSKVDGALIVMGDQPDVSDEAVAEVVAAYRPGKTPAVVPKYRYARGNPVLVDRLLWPRLMSLEGDEGARRLLDAHPDWVTEVWLGIRPPRDVDTSFDVEELQPRQVRHDADDERTRRGASNLDRPGSA